MCEGQVLKLCGNANTLAFYISNANAQKKEKNKIKKTAQENEVVRIKGS